MGKFFLHAGAIGLRRTEAEEARDPLPAGATDVVTFDENDAGNAAHVADFNTGYARFSYVGGVLHKDAAPVSFNPELAQTTQARAKYVGAIRLTANRQTTSNALSDVTGLRFHLEANSHYIFNFTGAYTTAGATTGMSLAVNGPASPNLVRVVGCIAESATASRNGAAGAYDTAIAGLNSGGATALPFWLEGNISTGASSGILILRFASETNGNAVTILAGSWGELKKVG